MRFSFLAVLAAGALVFPACAGAEGDAGDARTDDLTSTCAGAHLASLKVTKFSEGVEDLEACAPGAALTPDVVAAIADIKDLNDKAAVLFGVDANQLFGSGIRISIHTSETGFNGAFETHDDDDLPRVTIETVDKPEHLVNRGVYAHELSHWLLWVPRDRMPIALRSLGQSHFWGESIADTIALALEGTITSPEKGMPACLESRSPAGLANRSYHGPNGFFLNRFQRSQSFACCEQIADKPGFEKGIASCDAQLELEQSSPFDPSIPFDDTPFPVVEAASRLREYSRYQLGIPLNSFLLHAQREIDPGIVRRFVEAGKAAHPIDYTCKLGNTTDGNVRVTTASVREQLALVRKSLAPAKQLAFDVIAAEHGLDALDTLEPAELDERARGLATNLLLIDGAPGQGKPLPEGHSCILELQFSQLSGMTEPGPGCAVKCTRAP